MEKGEGQFGWSTKLRKKKRLYGDIGMVIGKLKQGKVMVMALQDQATWLLLKREEANNSFHDMPNDIEG